MAELAQDNGGGGGKKRPKKAPARIDMTPMVDLGFLLLTFFVLTSTFAKPKMMSLVYPAKEKKDQPPPEDNKVNNAITFILSKDRVFYYKGEFYPEGNKKGKPATQLTETDFGPQGIRKLLADENKFVIRKKIELDAKLQRKEINDSIYKKEIIEAKKNPEALKVLVKTDMKAKTINFIDVIDELYISSIGVIAPVDLMNSEQALLDKELAK
jgi:biopolymer transport protein ExbD